MTIAATLALASPQPSVSPTPAPAAAGTFDLSGLSAEQRAKLELAIIKTSQNPVGNITVVPFQNNANYGVGPAAGYQYNMNVQPVIPIMLNKRWNLIARTIVPFVGQTPASGIGDTQEQLYFAPRTKPGELIWGMGPIFSFPTGSPQDKLGSAKWGAGVDAVALVMPGKWVIGALMTQTWSVAGNPNRAQYSNFLVQPFVNYNLANGWAISTAPTITANWTAPGHAWAVPLGGIVGKTFRINGQLMSLGLGYYTYVSRPVSQPQTQVRLQWSLLWPVKRGVNVQELLQEGQ